MTRETKLSLLVAFALLLVVGVLISDHFSASTRTESARFIASDAIEANGGTAALPQDQPLRLAQDATGTAPTFNQRAAQLAGNMVDGINNTLLNSLDDIVNNNQTPALTNITPTRATDDTAAAQHTQESADEPTLPVEIPTVRGYPAVDTELQNTPQTDNTRQWVRHTATTDDTPWSLAVLYFGDGTKWRLLREHNPHAITAEGVLQAGQVLMIPPTSFSFQQAAPAPRTNDAQASPTATPPKPQPVKRVYVVQKGDTLSSIAREQLGSAKHWRTLYDFNASKIDNPDRVRVGITLNLPTIN